MFVSGRYSPRCQTHKIPVELSGLNVDFAAATLLARFADLILGQAVGVFFVGKNQGRAQVNFSSRWWFHVFFQIFTLMFGEMIQFDSCNIFKWVEKNN